MNKLYILLIGLALGGLFTTGVGFWAEQRPDCYEDQYFTVNTTDNRLPRYGCANMDDTRLYKLRSASDGY